MSDYDNVALMLGREPRGEVQVAARCHLGLPVVIENPPVLPGGEPFPTRYWLTCPLAVELINSAESNGAISEFGAALDVSVADAEYADGRDAIVAEMRERGDIAEGAPLPSGGVGGATGGVKCLHARYAYWRAGGADPAGAATAERIGEPDCVRSCIATGEVEIVRPVAEAAGAVTETRRSVRP